MRFEIKNRHIKLCEKCDTIGDNSDYIAQFEFDEEWNGVTKTARFIACNGKYVDRILKDDQCDVPCEVLKCGHIKVGVYSATMTTTYCQKYIKESVKEKTGTPAEPTPDVYSQLTKHLDDIQAQMPVEVEEQVTEYFTEHKEELKGDPNTLTIGTVTSGDKPSAEITGDSPNQVLNLVLEKGEQGIQGKQGEQGYTPIREVDYWTAEDQEKIISDVLTSDTVVQLEKTASTALSIAKGANQTVRFESYEAMIAKLNTLEKDVYNAGQNIYIKTTGVPDLWIYEIHDESTPYSYTDDTTIANIFLNNGTIIVGHYELSMLETDKVDLTEYEKTADVDEKIKDLKENAALTYMSINAITLKENPTNGAFTLIVNKG